MLDHKTFSRDQLMFAILDLETIALTNRLDKNTLPKISDLEILRAKRLSQKIQTYLNLNVRKDGRLFTKYLRTTHVPLSRKENQTLSLWLDLQLSQKRRLKLICRKKRCITFKHRL